MATRAIRQQSVATTAGSSRAADNGRAALPPYEAPQFSLTPSAQRALANLAHAHSLRKLDNHLSEAQAAVSTAAADINDRVHEAEINIKKRKAREEREGVEGAGDEDAEKSLDELREKVERMTQRMEESMRRLIDGQYGVQSIKESMGATAEFARVNASTQASTQGRSQRRRPNADDGDEEDGDYEDYEPTDPAAGTQAQRSLIDKFKKDIDNAKTRYQSHSLAARYSENNDYVSFKRVVHDAQHRDDGVELPHKSEWFPEGERPAPGVTTRRARADADDAESDDDIAVSKASVSTKCPLTLQEFKEPLTSTKCPHSFEKDAILGMIQQARPVQGQAKAVQCPVSGCSKMLTKADLQMDKVLVRKIRRLQEAARLEEEEESEDEGVPGSQRRAAVIGDDEEGEDVDEIVEGTQVKGEPRVTQTQTQGRAGGGVVDLAGESSEEEADEEEDEMEE